MFRLKKLEHITVNTMVRKKISVGEKHILFNFTVFGKPFIS